MSSSDESKPPFKSSYPELTRPDFKPNVPDFLLENASDQDKYIISQLSLVNQYAQWSVNTEMSTHEQVLRTNGDNCSELSDELAVGLAFCMEVCTFTVCMFLYVCSL